MRALFARLRAMVHRLVSPLFFRTVGPGCRIYAGVCRATVTTNVHLGSGTVVGEGVFFHTGRRSAVRIGSGTTLNTACHIVAMEAVEIGDNVAIGEFVSIRDQEHRFSTARGVRDQGYNVGSVKISSNVWIGRGVYIGPGTVIQSGTIIGANSVVKGAFPPNVLIAGAPARIKRRLDDWSHAEKKVGTQAPVRCQ